MENRENKTYAVREDGGHGCIIIVSSLFIRVAGIIQI